MNSSMMSPEQARNLVRKSRAKMSIYADEVEAPDILADQLADPSDGTVHARLLTDESAGLTLLIPKWENLGSPTRPSTLTIYLDDHTTQIFSSKYDQSHEADFPLPIALGHDLLAGIGDGTRQFFYTVLTGNGQQIQSLPLVLIFDRVPPYGTGAVPAVPPVSNVTDANKNAVKVVLPKYNDWALGDQVAVFWLNEVPADPWALPPTVLVPVTANADQDITIPVADIEKAGNGGISVVYVLLDKAGNKSLPSIATPVGVALGTLPATFAPPEVPLALDGLIDQADLVTQVDIHVPFFADSIADDEVRVSWGNYTSPWRKVMAEGNFPLKFAIEPKVIWENYGGDAGRGVVSVKVSYEVQRGTVPLTTQEIDVDVNLERIGPPVDPIVDPWPDPTNPELDPLQVYGAVSATLNKLEEADRGEDATVKFELHSAFKEDDVISFFWRNVHVIELDHPIEAAELGTEITKTLPWRYIDDGGNGTVPVYYKITRPGNPNPAQAPLTQVDVQAVDELLDAPTFDGVNGAGFLICDSLWSNPAHPLDPAIRVVVPSLAQFGVQVGDKVKMHWWATTEESATPIPAVELTEEYTLEAADLTGFVWRVQPYATHILPIYQHDGADPNGLGYVTYEFTVDSKTYKSKEVEGLVGMYSGGGTCSTTRP